LSAGDLVEVYNGATQAMAYPTRTARRKRTFMPFAFPMGVQGDVVSQRARHSQ
jgi:arsenite oxidase large subunit